MTRGRSTSATEAQAERLLGILDGLRAECVQAEEKLAPTLVRVSPTHRAGARNLVRYVAFRRHDLRRVQVDLARLGLSSLGRSEAHVLETLDAVISVLRRLSGVAPAATASAVPIRAPELARHATRLLGRSARDRATRVMVTLPSESADDRVLVEEFVRAGMDVARINCAHDTADEWRKMAANVRTAAADHGRTCQIAMDLGGPKLRTGPLPMGPPVLRVAPVRGARGVVQASARVWPHQGSPAEVPPAGTKAIPVVPARALRHCREGDEIELRDARGARRRLLVVEVRPDGSVVAEVSETTYFESALPLEIPRSGKTTAAIGDLPRRPTALTLHQGDELVVTRNPEHEPCPAGPLRISCTLPEVFDHARPGHRVWFDDGKIGGIITAVTPDALTVDILRRLRAWDPDRARLRDLDL